MTTPPLFFTCVLMSVALGGCNQSLPKTSDSADASGGGVALGTEAAGGTDEKQSADEMGGRGGQSSAEAGRAASVCPAGATYPEPNLSDQPTLIYSGQGTGLFEGPVWIGDTLYFSDMSFEGDVPPSDIMKLTPPLDEAEVFLADAGSNGLAVSATGELHACQHSSQDVARISLTDGATTPVVSDFSGKEFNSPNDLAIRSDGTLYFSDPDYQQGSRTPEIGYTGVFRVSPAGTLAVVDDSLDKPNGVTLSPDETRLYVGDSSGAISMYAVAPDGTTGPRQEFAQGIAGPYGMTVDCAGNVYVAAHDAGTVYVFSPDGDELGSIAVGPHATNVAFGGQDGQTLYITAEKNLYALQMNLPGWPY